ncbi:MAG: hypothetical protein RMI94_06810 [Bryobacterales bacterium]|nr:hypothetical protein [Bryobacteraceae bacterium]MDW8130242.1 hypothetical protein [Bryobacterales bacterium]
MRCTAALRSAGLVLALLPATTLAAEGGVASHGPAHVDLWKLANFALFAGAAVYVLRKRAGVFFRSRTEQIQRAIREAAAFEQDAEKRLAEIEQRLAGVSEEIELMRQQAAQEAAAERARLERQIQEEMQKIQEEASQEIEAMVKSARQRLRAEAAELAIALAAEQIRQRMTAEDDDRWIRGMAEELSRRAPGVG